jgi:hypothetical protein
LRAFMRHDLSHATGADDKNVTFHVFSTPLVREGLGEGGFEILVVE